MNTAVLRRNPSATAQPIAQKRAVERLLSPLDFTAEASTHILSKSFGHFESAGRNYSLPRYVYLGPKGGGDIIRIGIFATIHGDEPEGALAVTRLVTLLEENRELAQGYALFLYPVCNHTGFED